VADERVAGDARARARCEIVRMCGSARNSAYACVLGEGGSDRILGCACGVLREEVAQTRRAGRRALGHCNSLRRAGCIVIWGTAQTWGQQGAQCDQRPHPALKNGRGGMHVTTSSWSTQHPTQRGESREGGGDAGAGQEQPQLRGCGRRGQAVGEASRILAAGAHARRGPAARPHR
jgi:hypothetical protein